MSKTVLEQIDGLLEQALKEADGLGVEIVTREAELASLKELQARTERVVKALSKVAG